MVNLIKIEKLEEMTKYEDSKNSETTRSSKKWTKGVPIILVHEDGRVIVTDHWIYLSHYDELVYNKKKNSWCQGSKCYDIGKSHIKEIYIVQAI
ncbi:hypothetical protein P4V86_19325 [Brevibacillus laterosporus]|uniref:hypothetical protein n=1 Tax=Brevibacillus laterosporus TaxID=1465 RepID=UPI00037F2830|nr:hypothetical protein [Brevibacillus laterosporus]ATO50124.1 hypothetical protein BrL25_14175 [Brevibacillus laterosporus DSM 25]MED2005474.1 hypothetical protein [Brevibacillus laterosporus]